MWIRVSCLCFLPIHKIYFKIRFFEGYLQGSGGGGVWRIYSRVVKVIRYLSHNKCCLNRFDWLSFFIFFNKKSLGKKSEPGWWSFIRASVLQIIEASFGNNLDKLTLHFPIHKL